MADDLLMLFDIIDNNFPDRRHVSLPRINPMESFDEEKFRERFRLSKSVVCRLADEVGNCISNNHSLKQPNA